MADVYFWRQLLVVLSLFLHSICDGVSYSFPGLVNSVILAPNSTDIRATRAQASQIASIPGVGCFIGIFFLSALMQNIGRRLTYICILILDLISWSILPFADSVNAILAARLIRGLGDGLLFNGIMISEYVDPTRRGYFTTIRKMCVGVGALLSHTMVLRYTFREIALIPVSSLLTSIILTFFWPESPAYSAFRGRFKECKRNFEYLHGKSKKKQEELENLMGAQMVINEKMNKKNNVLMSILNTIMKKDFMKALMITTILIMVIELCGRHYYLAFINDVFLMIVGDKSIAAYCSILSDILIIFSLIISSFIISCFKRRTLVFFFGFLSVALIFIISITELLKSKYSIGLLLSWLVPSVMLVLNFIVNMGIVPINLLLIVEIYPVDCRGLGLCVASFNFILFNYLFGLKLTPFMVQSIGLDVTFGIFGVSIVICMVILFYILPETKDRTMQEIEDEVKNLGKSMIELRPMLLKEKIEIQT